MADGARAAEVGGARSGRLHLPLRHLLAVQPVCPAAPSDGPVRRSAAAAGAVSQGTLRPVG